MSYSTQSSGGRMSHLMEGRRSPLQFIDTPTGSEHASPHPLYATTPTSTTGTTIIGPSPNLRSTLQNRSSGGGGPGISAALSSGLMSPATGPSQYHYGSHSGLGQTSSTAQYNYSSQNTLNPSTSSSQYHYGAHSPSTTNPLLAGTHHRSTSSQSIQSLMQDRHHDNLLSVNTSLGGSSHPSSYHHLSVSDRPRAASAREQPYMDFHQLSPHMPSHQLHQDSSTAGGVLGRRLRGASADSRLSDSVRMTTSLDRPGLSSISSSTAGLSSSRLLHQSLTNPTGHHQSLANTTSSQFGLHQSLGTTSLMGGIRGGLLASSLKPHNRSLSYDFSVDKEEGHPPASSSGYVSGSSQPDHSALFLDYPGAVPPGEGRGADQLDVAKEKLASCMNSIKTFWSPELKRERALRKEEKAKYALLADHMHQVQLEKQNMLSNMHALEMELRKLQEDENNRHHKQASAHEWDLLRRRCEELDKENRVLVKQLDEADRRLSNQKAALNGQEEGIRRLMEMVKSKGGSIGQLESDRGEIERLRCQLEEYSSRLLEVDRVGVQKDAEMNAIKEELESTIQENRMLKKENDCLLQDARQAQTLQSLIDTKDSKMLTLESEIRLLEDEISRLREEGRVTPTASVSSGIDDFDKTVHTLKNNERMLKSKIDMLNTEVTKRDSEIYALQSRLEMAEKQQQDQNHHINVLKEQVKARDHKVSMLSTDVEDFRKRLKEKDQMMEKKTKQVTQAQSEKRQVEAELLELKDQMDIKDRKISVFQRKIENLEDLLNDKDSQLSSAKARLANLHSEHTSAEGTKSGLEETVREKDRQLERIKEQKTRMENDYQEEVTLQKKLASESRARMDSVQRECEEKQKMILDLREELSEVKSERFKRETEMSQLQSQLGQKTAELAALQMDMTLLKKQMSNETEMKLNQRVTDLESQASHYMESSVKLQSEVDRLLGLLRSIETEKIDKDNQIHEMEEQLKEAANQLNNMKRCQQADRKKQAQLIEESRRREETDYDGVKVRQTQNQLAEREARIRELEGALKESVKITTEREVFAADREELLRQLEQQHLDQRSSTDQIQRERNNFSAQLANLQEELRDKEAQLKTLETECFQGYIPELDKLRKVNLDSAQSIASLVKIVQGKENHLSEQEKINLQNIPLYPDYTGSYLPRSHHTAGGGLSGSGNFTTSQNSAFQSLTPVNDERHHLNRMLQDKEQQIIHLTQQLEDLSHLRFQNNELESRIKSLQRELEEKSSRAGYIETHQMSASSELSQLRHSNSELSSKLAQMRRLMEDKEERLRSLEQECARDQYSELERVKRELNSTITDRDTHISVLNNDIERLKAEKNEINTNLMLQQQELRDKSDRVRQVETEYSKYRLDFESLQKKYQAILGQLTDKNDRIQVLERECFHIQADEIKKLRCEHEEASHRLSFMQKSLNDRDNKIDQLEKDHFKQREDMSAMRKQLHHTEDDMKTLREELAYREDRIKQMQVAHNDEILRLRNLNQDVTVRNNEMKATLDEKENLVKGLASENEKLKTDFDHSRRRVREYENEMSILNSELMQKEEKLKIYESEYADEISRYQKATEEATQRLMVLQKRVDEREGRLRKIEQENHDLLDEIHMLRKRNHDLESQLDSARQQLIEKDDVVPSRSSSSMDMGYSSQHTLLVSSQNHYHDKRPEISSANSIELERLRKQYNEVTSSLSHLQKVMEETQMQYDQVSNERDSLHKQVCEDRIKIHQIQQTLHEKDVKLRRYEAESLRVDSACSIRKSEENIHLGSRFVSPVRESPSMLNQLRQELNNRDQQYELMCMERDTIQKQLNEERMKNRQLQQFLNDKDSHIQTIELELSQKFDGPPTDTTLKDQEFERIFAERNILQTNLNEEKLKSRKLQQQLDEREFHQPPPSPARSVDFDSMGKQMEDSGRYSRSGKESPAVAIQLRQELMAKEKKCEQLRLEKEGLQRLLNDEKSTTQRLQKALETDGVSHQMKSSDGTDMAITQLKQQIELKENQVQQGRANVTTLEMTIAQLKQQIELKENQLRQLKVNENNAEMNINQLKQQIELKDNQMRQIVATYETSEATVGQLRQQIEMKDNQMRQMKPNDNSEQVIAQLRQQLESKETQLKQLQANTSAETTIAQLRQQLETQIAQAGKANENADASITQLRQQVEMREAQLRQISSVHETAESNMAHLKQQLEMRENQLRQFTASDGSDITVQLRQQLEMRENQHNQLSMELDSLHKQLTEEKEKTTQLQRYIQENDMQMRNMEADMMQKHGGGDMAARMRQQTEEFTQKMTQAQDEVEMREHQMQQLTTELERCLTENQELYQKLSQVSSTGGSQSPALQSINPEQRAEIEAKFNALQMELERSKEELHRKSDEQEMVIKEYQELQAKLQESNSKKEELATERDSLKEKLRSGSHTEDKSAQLSKELEKVKSDYETKLINCVEENEKLQTSFAEAQHKLKKMEQDLSNSKQNDSEKMLMIQTEMANQLQELQKELVKKDKQQKDLTTQLKNFLQENKELSQEVDKLEEEKREFQTHFEKIRNENATLLSERDEIDAWANQIKAELNTKNSQLQDMSKKQVQGKPSDPSNKMEDLYRQMEMKDKQMAHLSNQLEQSANEIADQQEMLQQLTRQLEASKLSANQGMPAGAQGANKSREDHLQQAVQLSQDELKEARRALQEKEQRIQTLETQCFQQQAEEIQALRQELQRARSGQPNGSNRQSPQSQESHELKMEVDQLKREVAQKVDALQRMERDCAEKHVKRLEAQQMKLKRLEEESGGMGKTLDDLKRAIEERDRLIKQMRADSHNATSVELERLREEHAHCGEVISVLQEEMVNARSSGGGGGSGEVEQRLRKVQSELDQKSKQVRGLEQQLDRQMEEVLQTKQEALTASMCEKDANMALMEMTGVKNPQTTKAIEALRNEKSTIQTQLRQVSQALAMMKEERANRS